MGRGGSRARVDRRFQWERDQRIGNPPEYLVKGFIYDHPALGIVLRTRFSRPDEGAVVKVGEEGMPMMTIDYENPEEAEETLFSHLEIYLESII